MNIDRPAHPAAITISLTGEAPAPMLFSMKRGLPNAKRHVYSRRITGYIVLVLLTTILYQPVVAFSLTDVPGPINDAAMQLVQFCIEPKAGLDEHAIATLVDYVLSSKQNREYALLNSQKCSGAYYEFDTKITFSRFVEYSYNPLIPSVITRPSSVRYSIWTSLRGETQRLLDSWKPVPSAGVPVVIHGLQREADTPDATTGVYHEYDLKRTLILLNYNEHQVLLTVSKQIGESNVGKKGAILGNDNDWSYYYSGVPGSSRTGFGWVKSYIYDFFSVGVYVESNTAPTMVRAGVFQWLRAGWSGMNFVKSGHILNGIKRSALCRKMILESPRMPPPNQIISVYQRLSNMPTSELIKKYAALQQALRSSAFQVGIISKSQLDEQVSFANTSREQMVEELMLEYLKMTLGKQTLLEEQF
jgi:hypothetical protein